MTVNRVKRLAKFLALSRAEQRDLTEAALSLSAARLILLLPFRWLPRLIGLPLVGVGCTSFALDEERSAVVLAVRRAILRASERLPWKSSCLVRALAAKMMLTRRGLPSLLQLGVRLGTTKELFAHAWLRCGEIEVVGAEDLAEFSPIAGFQS